MNVKFEQIIITILVVALIVVSGVFYMLINESKSQHSNMETVTKNAIGSTVEVATRTHARTAAENGKKMTLLPSPRFNVSL